MRRTARSAGYTGASDELNDALLRLIALMNAQGVEIKDTLPLSQSSPYVYDTETRTDEVSTCTPR